MLVELPKNKPASWPPRGYTTVHSVREGDNWWTLAGMYGRKDPWDIIRFNFETGNPKEVNWFLHEYVGCRGSKDGKNFSFSSADRPGLIYIPPASWTPGGGLRPSGSSDDESARRAVLNVLSDHRLAKVGFSYRGYSITWPLLIAVANRIIDRRVQVRYDPKLSDPAQYDPTDNTIYLRFKGALSVSQKALVVHEVVHAALDLKKAGELVVSEAEATAYLAQAIYALEIFPAGYVMIGEDGFGQVTFDLAWDIAVMLKKGKKLSELSLEMYAIEASVAVNPKYKRTAGQKTGYDGV